MVAHVEAIRRSLPSRLASRLDLHYLVALEHCDAEVRTRVMLDLGTAHFDFLHVNSMNSMNSMKSVQRARGPPVQWGVASGSAWHEGPHAITRCIMQKLASDCERFYSEQ